MTVAIKKNIWLCYFLWQFFELHLQNKKYETWLLIYTSFFSWMAALLASSETQACHQVFGWIPTEAVATRVFACFPSCPYLAMRHACSPDSSQTLTCPPAPGLQDCCSVTFSQAFMSPSLLDPSLSRFCDSCVRSHSSNESLFHNMLLWLPQLNADRFSHIPNKYVLPDELWRGRVCWVSDRGGGEVILIWLCSLTPLLLMTRCTDLG